MDRYSLAAPFTQCITLTLILTLSSVLKTNPNEKKHPEETQKLRAGCSKAEPKKNSPGRRPLPGGAGRPKFNQLEMVTTFTYKPSLVKIDVRNFELSW